MNVSTLYILKKLVYHETMRNGIVSYLLFDQSFQLFLKNFLIFLNIFFENNISNNTFAENVVRVAYHCRFSNLCVFILNYKLKCTHCSLLETIFHINIYQCIFNFSCTNSVSANVYNIIYSTCNLEVAFVVS